MITIAIFPARNEAGDLIKRISSEDAVELTGIDTHRVHYTRRPFPKDSDLGGTSVNYDRTERLERAEDPR